MPNCKYREIYFSNPDVKLKSKCLSFFHLNINSLSKKFDNFNHLINELKLEFDILGISESRISIFKHKCQFKELCHWTKLQLNQQQERFCYILLKDISYKTHPDLAIYKPKTWINFCWSCFTQEKQLDYWMYL